MALRKAGPPDSVVWWVLGLVVLVFHVALVFSGLVSPLVARPLHMALALPWIFLALAGSRSDRITGVIFTTAGGLACLWVAINASRLGDQYGSLEGSLQLGIAWVLMITVLEMSRRAIGWPLPLVATCALLYGVFGQLIPGEFGHAGIPLASFLGTMTIAEGGLWGKLTGVSVSIVAIFVIFGAVLNAGEAGEGFMNLATASAGRLKGGAAKVSVLASAFFGSISGSASANVASTGAITLPAMRKLGYPRALAGAVEAVASSGGQIMPPLMGAGAFVMVELTGEPYTRIMGAAFLPALLYFLAVWIGINAFAERYTLRSVPASERPPARRVASTALFFALPFAVLLERLFFGGYTPQYAACVALLVAAVLLLFDARFSLSWPRTVTRFRQALITIGSQVAMIASIILCASIVIGVLGQTGLGVKITSLILSASGGALWPALLLTALACLVLGMEVPTTAAYVICVSVAGPGLQQLGLEPLVAHLFVFWFALLSTITPPVCGAVFIAAAMVESNWLRVAVSAMALGIGLYLVPLAMVGNVELIRLAETPTASIGVFLLIAMGLMAVSFGMISPRPVWVRLLLVLAGFGALFARPLLQ